MREGPLYTTRAWCEGCKHCEATYYQRQGDSGFDVRCMKIDRAVGSWSTPEWCPLAKREIDVQRLRARVIVSAEDITAARITLEHIKAWLTARGWALDGGINTTGGAPWEEWRPIADIETARARRRRIAGTRICLYVVPTDGDLAGHVQDVAKAFGIIGLDLVDEIRALAESASTSPRSDQA